MQIHTAMRGRGLAALLGVFLGGLLSARPATPTLISEPQTRAFVSQLLTWDDHGVLAYYGGPQDHKVVRLQRLDNALGIWSRPIPLTDARREAYEPRLAASGNDLLVAWYEKNPENGEFAALIARLDWLGHPQWYHVLSHPGRSGQNPVVRTAADGAWVAWLESEDAGGNAVWVEHLSPRGEPLGEAQRAGSADRDTTHLNAAVDAAGRFHVVYDAKLGGRAREVQLLTVASGGVQQHALTSDDGADSIFPDIAIEGERVALCWVDARAGQRAVLLGMGAAVDLGTALDTKAAVLTSGAGEVGGSYLAWNQGRLGVVWNVAGEDAGVFLQRFDARGRATGKPVNVVHPAAPARAAVPALAAWKKGFAVAWNEYTTDDVQHQVEGSIAYLATVN